MDCSVEATLTAAFWSKQWFTTRYWAKWRISSDMRGKLTGSSTAIFSRSALMVRGLSFVGVRVPSATISFSNAFRRSGNGESALKSRLSFLWSAVLINA